MGVPVSHKPALQLSLAQSPPTTQTFPEPHAAHSEPPQSKSVSCPFLMLSLHEVAVGLLEGICVGAAVGAIVGILLGIAEGDALGNFVGVGVPHCPASQSPLKQSLPKPQTLPPPQLGHSTPPQSVSVSTPFWVPSLHVEGVGSDVGVEVGISEGEAEGDEVGLRLGDAVGA